MDDVEAVPSAPEERVRGAKAPAQLDRRARQRARSRRELVELDVQAAELAQRGDLVADEAAALGMGGVGEHVGDDERAHDRSDRSALE